MDEPKEPVYLLDEDAAKITLIIEDFLKAQGFDNKFLLVIQSPTNIMMAGTSCPICVNKKMLDCIIESKLPHLEEIEGVDYHSDELVIKDISLKAKSQDVTDKDKSAKSGLKVVVSNPNPKTQH